MVSRLLSLLFAIWASAAFATPERVATVRDTLLGLSPGHAWVLREIADNRGIHYGAFLDQHLVEIDLTTHVATRHWKLRSMELGWEGTDPDHAHHVEAALAPVNVFLTLREARALPPRPARAPFDHDPWSIEGGALVHTTGEARTVVLWPIALRRHVTAQLDPLLKTYPPDPEPGFMGSRIDVAPIPEEAEVICQVIALHAPSHLAPGRLQPLRLGCDIPGGGLAHVEVLIFVAPPG